MRPRSAGQAGFTLLEVVVALAITGMVVVGARAVMARLGDDGARLAAASAQADAEANSGLLLRELLGRAEASSPSGERFVGGPRALRFATRCDVPAGWQERCHAELGIMEVSGVPTVGLILSTGEAMVVRRGFRGARLRYLAAAENGGRWTQGWSSNVSLPLAVGLEVDGELSILVIGERG